MDQLQQRRSVEDLPSGPDLMIAVVSEISSSRFSSPVRFPRVPMNRLEWEPNIAESSHSTRRQCPCLEDQLWREPCALNRYGLDAVRAPSCDLSQSEIARDAYHRRQQSDASTRVRAVQKIGLEITLAVVATVRCLGPHRSYSFSN